MVFSLVAPSSFAQPVVKVPKACEVVVAGTGNGSSTGFGSAVGDGGIVVMPDPFDFRSDEGNFYYISNDTELLQWNLLGDLSMQTETSYNEVLQPTGAINPLNIQSYNKNLRLAENPSATQPLLDPKWARSKGRITVLYYNKECNSIITFQILKRYENKRNEQTQSVVPLILGSDCVCSLRLFSYLFSI